MSTKTEKSIMEKLNITKPSKEPKIQKKESEALFESISSTSFVSCPVGLGQVFGSKYPELSKAYIESDFSNSDVVVLSNILRSIEHLSDGNKFNFLKRISKHGLDSFALQEIYTDVLRSVMDEKYSQYSSSIYSYGLVSVTPEEIVSNTAFSFQPEPLDEAEVQSIHSTELDSYLKAIGLEDRVAKRFLKGDIRARAAALNSRFSNLRLTKSFDTVVPADGVSSNQANVLNACAEFAELSKENNVVFFELQDDTKSNDFSTVSSNESFSDQIAPYFTLPAHGLNMATVHAFTGMTPSEVIQELVLSTGHPEKDIKRDLSITRKSDPLLYSLLSQSDKEALDAMRQCEPFEYKGKLYLPAFFYKPSSTKDLQAYAFHLLEGSALSNAGFSDVGDTHMIYCLDPFAYKYLAMPTALAGFFSSKISDYTVAVTTSFHIRLQKMVPIFLYAFTLYLFDVYDNGNFKSISSCYQEVITGDTRDSYDAIMDESYVEQLANNVVLSNFRDLDKVLTGSEYTLRDILLITLSLLRKPIKYVGISPMSEDEREKKKAYTQVNNNVTLPVTTSSFNNRWFGAHTTAPKPQKDPLLPFVGKKFGFEVSSDEQSNPMSDAVSSDSSNSYVDDDMDQ